MSKALKHYIVYSGSSGWWHSENLSVQEWVNKIDQNMNSLCPTGNGRTYTIFSESGRVQRSGGVEQYHLCSVTIRPHKN